MRAATEATSALLSYKSDTVEAYLGAARDRFDRHFQRHLHLTDPRRRHPGAQQKHISAMATVPAAASVSATYNHAVVLVFVDQTVTVGNDPPSSTASSVRISLDKIGDRWLISQFDPV